jgi:hypothetical protein
VIPVVEECLAEDILTNPLHDQSLSFGATRESRCLCSEAIEGRRRQADRQFVNTIDGIMKFGERGQQQSGSARSGNLGVSYSREFFGYARMSNG